MWYLLYLEGQVLKMGLSTIYLQAIRSKKDRQLQLAGVNLRLILLRDADNNAEKKYHRYMKKSKRIRTEGRHRIT